MPSCAIRHGDRILLYYSGWCKLGGAAPYNNATGVAASDDGGTTFTRLFQGPILDRSPEEPWSATSPTVIHDGARWHMWYSSGTAWVEIDGKFEHEYILKHATSEDGIAWARSAKGVVPLLHPHESQTRPTILRDDAGWRMWFSFRGSHGFRTSGETYRLGHARSSNLIDWTRCDLEAGIDVSSEGWDSQMICYPDVIVLDRHAVMFFNGNNFGTTGFGAAVLEPD